MATSLEEIIKAKYANNIQTTQYQSNNVITVVDRFIVNNVSSNVVLISINLVEPSGSVDSSNLIVKDMKVPPNESRLLSELVGAVIEDGAYISTIASIGSSLVISASGRVIS